MDFCATKDAFTKENFWIYTISFEHEDGSSFDETVQLSANDTTILMFSEGEHYQIPAQFNLAPFAGTVQETLGDQKCGVENIIRKMNYKEMKPDVVQ